ncbi:MAG: hypothetical protein R2795_11025 [Saprospiraceae bacterium]
MYNFLSKHGQLAAFLLGVVLVLIFLAIAVPGAGNYNFADMDDAEIFGVNVFNFGILAAGFLTIVSAAGMVLFGLFHVLSNPKASMKGIIGVAVLAVVLFLFYNMAQGTADHDSIQGAIENYQTSAEGRFISEGNLKWIGGAIRLGILMSLLAFVALIVMPIISPFINRVK